MAGEAEGAETRAVREGEELDRGRLAAYLDGALGDHVAALEDIEIGQFPGGHSNLTYLVRRGGQELVLRRPPFGSKVKSAHDMGREVRVLSRLAPVYPRAPRPLAYCEDEAVIGARFYVMERRRGVILRKEPPRGVTVDAATAHRLCEVFVEALVELHAIDWQGIGLGDFGKPAGYVERQVSGWTQRWVGSKTEEVAVVDEVAAWLAANLPPDGPPSLIHNDFKFDNLVLDAADLTRIVGILDWEMSTIGDPLMDFGTSLGYWVEPTDSQPLQMMRFGPTTLPGMMTRRELADRYAERSGRDLGAIVFYYAYGLFKTAVVAQQIYYRFAQGLTKDPRFAQFAFGVKVLAEQAAAAIARGSV
jgi:aminoglycoside phosphotransferase (APT) family kinase protein